MPFQVNNVDSSVAANFLFGLLYQVFQGEVKPNEELVKMMSDIVDLLVYIVEEII